MLDIKFIRENPEKIKKATRDKQLDPKVVDRLLAVDRKRRNLLQKVDRLRAARNKLKAMEIEKGRRLKEQLKKLEPSLREVQEEFERLMLLIPNPAKPDVKVGEDESENEVIKKWGEPTKFDFKPRDHVELGEMLDLIDVKRTAKISGPRFGYLKNEAVLLEFALVKFALETLIKEGFIPVVPPVIIKEEVMEGLGYLEHGGREDMYVFEKDGLVLVGTSEQSIIPMHADEVLEEKELPKHYVGFSSCFRREAGAYGKDTRGIFRVHQFDKVEMIAFTKPEDSDKEHEYLLSLEEKLVQKLKLPYQVVKMCTGDLGSPAARKYDIEAWFPGQDRYREITSTSTCTDFQARRLNIRYRHQGKVNFVHILNGTAIAIGRVLIAILENCQQEDGSVQVPEILQKYVGKKIIKPRE